MNKVLILFAHPRSDRSEINVVMAERAAGLDGVTLIDLYGEYPDFCIDVDREQERLRQHDVVVFQHPLYWYSCPALLKEWQDMVLEHDFAFGTHGRELEGKTFLNAVTCGAQRQSYGPGGLNGHELRHFFLPFEFTARLCRMRFLPPFALFAAGYAVEQDRREPFIDGYVRLLQALIQGQVDWEKAQAAHLLSDDLDAVLTDGKGV